MEADHQAPVCVAGEIVIDSPPETVWDTLTDLSSWPQWMPGVKAMTVEEPVAVGTRFRWKAGPGTVNSEILEFESPRIVGWKGRTLGIAALHVWRLEGQGERTRVSTEESWNGPLARLLRGQMSTMLKRTLDDGVTALKHEAERRAA